MTIQNKLTALPERKVWNQATGRDGKQFTDGWNACLDAILARPVCGWTRTHGWHEYGRSIDYIIGCQPDGELRMKLEEDKYCPHCGREVEIINDD